MGTGSLRCNQASTARETEVIEEYHCLTVAATAPSGSGQCHVWASLLIAAGFWANYDCACTVLSVSVLVSTTGEIKFQSGLSPSQRRERECFVPEEKRGKTVTRREEKKKESRDERFYFYSWQAFAN